MKRFDIREKDALVFAIGITVLLVFMTTAIFANKINIMKSRIGAAESKYKRAAALYKNIEDNNKDMHLFKGDILLFVQKLQSLPGLKNKILSSNAVGTGSSIQIRMAGLNLTQLLEVLKTISAYKDIEVAQFILKRNFSSQKLVNLNIVLRKKI